MNAPKCFFVLEQFEIVQELVLSDLRKWSIGFQKDFTIASYTVAR